MTFAMQDVSSHLQSQKKSTESSIGVETVSTSSMACDPNGSPRKRLGSDSAVSAMTESMIDCTIAEYYPTGAPSNSLNSPTQHKKSQPETLEPIVKNRRSSAPMRFLQKVMRSQSPDVHLRVVPLPANVTPIPDSSNKVIHEVSPIAPEVVVADGDENRYESTIKVEENVDLNEVHTTGTELSNSRPQDGTDILNDVFLNSSLQLLQVQSEAKQKIRHMWTTAQHLRWESQLTEEGLNVLHQELINVMKTLTIEKLEGARHTKAGYLTLVQAPPSVLAAPGLPRPLQFFGTSSSTNNGMGTLTLGERMWVTLSEEQCRLEVTPVPRDEVVKLTMTQESGDTANAACLPPINSAPTSFSGLSKFKLPTSISWLLSDPVTQSGGDASGSTQDATQAMVSRLNIKLQGCHVRRVTAPRSSTASSVKQTTTRARFQVLVPTVRELPSTSISGDASLTTTVTPASDLPNAHTSYAIYVFEVVTNDDQGEREVQEWIQALDRVCMFHLYMLENHLRDATYMLQYQEVLEQYFPVCIPLTWLRNRLERMPSAAPTSVTGGRPPPSMTHAKFHHQQVQRRSSRNLSMIQIVKDLERDKILVDHQLLISCSSPNEQDGAMFMDESGRDNIAEIVKYLLTKVMLFAKRVSELTKSNTSLRRVSGSQSTGVISSNSITAPSSPSSRLSKFTEAKALAFIERVLRGGSRTQSGGDIYDAISFFCQQRQLSICPVSQDAHPVHMNVHEDDTNGSFQVEVEVTMHFKVVELANMMDDGDTLGNSLPREWAVIEGSLTRWFTLGKVSEPGTVTVRYIREPEEDIEDSTETI